MRIIKVYTIGGNSIAWRRQIDEICLRRDRKISFIHPETYRIGTSDKEFSELSKHLIYDSNVAIVNIDDIDDRASYDIGLIDAINMFGNKHIFIIGVGTNVDNIPAHIKESIFHFENHYEDAMDYIEYIFQQERII